MCFESSFSTPHNIVTRLTEREYDPVQAWIVAVSRITLDQHYACGQRRGAQFAIGGLREATGMVSTHTTPDGSKVSWAWP